MNETKKPKTWSAMTTASVVSRALRKAGFPMTSMDERGNWSAGYRVHRIGVSSTIAIYWRCGDDHHYRAAQKEERRERMAAIREFLSGRGYQINELGYIECEVE